MSVNPRSERYVYYQVMGKQWQEMVKDIINLRVDNQLRSCACKRFLLSVRPCRGH